jgi:hypothetical protein
VTHEADERVSRLDTGRLDVHGVFDTAGSTYIGFLASRMDPDRPQLNALRESIHKLGQEVRQPIWVAEVSRPEFRHWPPETVQVSCLRLVRNIPQFICIVDGSYGTPWNVAQLCVLELEMLSAALADKPFHFYLLAPYEPDARTETLLRALEMAKPDVSKATPKRPDEILADLRLRLTHGTGGGRARRQVRTRTFPNLDVEFLDGNFTPLSPAPPSLEVIRKLLARVESEIDQATRLVATWMALWHLCSAPHSQPQFAEFLPLWDSALSRWASAAAWYGLHGPHYLGRLAAVNTLIRIRRQMATLGHRDDMSIHGTYGARASEYYSMAKAESSHSFRRLLLQRALSDVNRALEARSSDQSGLLAIRGSVLQALGRLCAGLRDYRNALRIRIANNEDAGRIGEAESELGMGYVRVGRIWKGGQYLCAAPRTSSDPNATTSPREPFESSRSTTQ